MLRGTEHPFGQFKLAVQAMFPSQPFTHCQPTCWEGQSGEKKKPWPCASRAQQLPKACRAISIISATNPNTATYRLLWRQWTPPQPDSVKKETPRISLLICMRYCIIANYLEAQNQMQVIYCKMLSECETVNFIKHENTPLQSILSLTFAVVTLTSAFIK